MMKSEINLPMINKKLPLGTYQFTILPFNATPFWTPSNSTHLPPCYHPIDKPPLTSTLTAINLNSSLWLYSPFIKLQFYSHLHQTTSFLIHLHFYPPILWPTFTSVNLPFDWHALWFMCPYINVSFDLHFLRLKSPLIDWNPLQLMAPSIDVPIDLWPLQSMSPLFDEISEEMDEVLFDYCVCWDHGDQISDKDVTSLLAVTSHNNQLEQARLRCQW